MGIQRLATFSLLAFSALMLSFCGGGSSNNTQTSSSTTQSPEILYVVNNGTVFTYSVDPNALTANAVGAAVSLIPAEALIQFVPSPDDHFLYVLWNDAQGKEHISVYSTDSSGVPQTPAAQTLDVSSLYQFNIHRSGQFAYMMEVLNSNGLFTSQIRLFHVHPTSGILSEDPEIQGSYGPSYDWPAALYGLSRDGSKLYLTFNSTQGLEYRERSVNLRTGTLGPDIGLYTPGSHWGELVIGQKLLIDDYRPWNQSGYLDVFSNAPGPSHPIIHCTSAMFSACETATNVQLDAFGHYLFLTDPNTQSIRVAQIRMRTRRVVDTGGSFPFTAEIPGFSFSPDGTLVYAILASDNSVHIYGFNPASGALTPGGSALALPPSSGICPALRQ